MGLIDLIYPKNCLGCGMEGQYICNDCVAKVRLTSPICPYCEQLSEGGATHISCARMGGLDGLFSVWEYEGVIRKAILALKYKYSVEVGSELASVFLKYLQCSRMPTPKPTLLVPIPMYRHKENFRGFNQSILIGGNVSKAQGWKFEPSLVVKNKSTISQVDLKGEARRHNLSDVFTLNSRVDTTNMIILFDDVFTTGSTLKEAAKVLKKAGVEKVWGLTIAR